MTALEGGHLFAHLTKLDSSRAWLSKEVSFLQKSKLLTFKFIIHNKNQKVGNI